MSGAGAAARAGLLGDLMDANALLLKMAAYAKQAEPAGQSFFVELLPHLEVVMAELAEYVFLAPQDTTVSTENLRALMRERQVQTLDIYRFEAYAYLLARIG